MAPILKLFYYILLLTFAVCVIKTCLADEIDIKSIDSGEISTIKGYVFSEKAEERLKEINETKKSLEKENISLEKLNSINNEEIKNLGDKIVNENEISKEYSNQLDREKNRSTFNKIVYFLGGAVIGAVIIKAKK